MIFQITSVNVKYQNEEVNEVLVYFNGRDETRSINISGYIPLTAEEYAGNESIVTLTDIVRQRVLEKLNGTA